MRRLTIFLIPITAFLIISCQPTAKIAATYCPEYRTENFERIQISQGRIAVMPMTCEAGLENQLTMLEQDLNNSLSSDFSQENVVSSDVVYSNLTDLGLANAYWEFIKQYETDGNIDKGLLYQLGDMFDVNFLLDIHLSSIPRKPSQGALIDINVESRIWDTEQGMLVWKGKGGYSGIHTEESELIQRTAVGISSILGKDIGKGPCENTDQLEESVVKSNDKTNTVIFYTAIIVVPTIIILSAINALLNGLSNIQL